MFMPMERSRGVDLEVAKSLTKATWGIEDVQGYLITFGHPELKLLKQLFFVRFHLLAMQLPARARCHLAWQPGF